MTDNVHHPQHYDGPFECIELTEQYDFCLGNAIKRTYALFDGSLIDAKQEIQTRIEKLTANYPIRVIPTDKITQQTIR